MGHYVEYQTRKGAGHEGDWIEEVLAGIPTEPTLDIPDIPEDTVVEEYPSDVIPLLFVMASGADTLKVAGLRELADGSEHILRVGKYTNQVVKVHVSSANTKHTYDEREVSEATHDAQIVAITKAENSGLYLRPGAEHRQDNMRALRALYPDLKEDVLARAMVLIVSTDIISYVRPTGARDFRQLLKPTSLEEIDENYKDLIVGGDVKLEGGIAVRLLSNGNEPASAGIATRVTSHFRYNPFSIKVLEKARDFMEQTGLLWTVNGGIGWGEDPFVTQIDRDSISNTIIKGAMDDDMERSPIRIREIATGQLPDILLLGLRLVAESLNGKKVQNSSFSAQMRIIVNKFSSPRNHLAIWSQAPQIHLKRS